MNIQVTCSPSLKRLSAIPSGKIKFPSLCYHYPKLAFNNYSIEDSIPLLAPLI